MFISSFENRLFRGGRALPPTQRGRSTFNCGGDAIFAPSRFQINIHNAVPFRLFAYGNRDV